MYLSTIHSTKTFIVYPNFKQPGKIEIEMKWSWKIELRKYLFVNLSLVEK